MDAADAARREDRDPGGRSRDHRRRDGRRRPAALGQGDREARACRLPDRARGRRRERLEGRRRPARRAAARRARRPSPGRHPAVSRTAASEAAGDLEVLRIRQAVADERRFERDDRPALRRGPLATSGATTSRSATDRSGRTYPKPSGAARLSRMPRRRAMTPEDIRRMVVVEELDLSVDGRTAVVVRRSIRGNRYLGHLFAIDLASGRDVPTPRQLTRGTIRDTKPRLCPDGHTLAFIRSDPTDDDSVAAIGILDLRRPDRVRMARVGGHGAVGEVAWSPDGRRLAFTAEVDPPRFISGRTRPDLAPRYGEGRGCRGAPGPPHHPDGLALGRGGSPRPLVAPVRPRHARRPAAPGHERRLGRRGHRLAPRRPNDRVLQRPRPGARPPPADDDLGRRRRRPRWRAARGPRARRLGDAAGMVAGRPLDRRPGHPRRRTRSTTSARASCSGRPMARDRPGSSRRTSIGPIGNWVDSDLTGWFVYGRTRPVLAR